MFNKDEKPDIKTFFSKEESKPEPEQPKKEDAKSSSGYEGRRPNRVLNDGKDWKDFH
jgi:hypothetical protein|tara:strand:+ start:1165 stop:1335 length:171 start_codon:yes stop_codon:yes gene_type:complete